MGVLDTQIAVDELQSQMPYYASNYIFLQFLVSKMNRGRFPCH